MSLLQVIVLVSGVVFILFGIDIYKRKKMNVLHFIIFVGGGGMIALFALNQQLLDKVGKIFGTRWADLLVYIALIFLFYFYMELVNNQTKDKTQLTKLVSQLAINDAYREAKEQIKNRKNTNAVEDDFIFNIRVYNEAKMVGKVIDEIYASGYSKIMAINDGSSDDTLSILQEKKKQYPNKMLIIASHTINRGWGAANQTGFNFVKKHGDELQIKRLVGFDADGQMDIKDMEIFKKAIQQHPADMYLGSRFLKGSVRENMPFFRKIILFISKAITLIFYGANISDPHSGYKIISLATLRKIELTADGMHYANELNEHIKKLKIKYHEVPVHVRYTDYSLGKWQKNSNSIRLAAEMIYRKIFFR